MDVLGATVGIPVVGLVDGMDVLGIKLGDELGLAVDGLVDGVDVLGEGTADGAAEGVSVGSAVVLVPVVN